MALVFGLILELLEWDSSGESFQGVPLVVLWWLLQGAWAMFFVWTRGKVANEKTIVED